MDKRKYIWFLLLHLVLFTHIGPNCAIILLVVLVPSAAAADFVSVQLRGVGSLRQAMMWLNTR